MSNASHCLVCGRRLRNAVFCPFCAASLCCSACFRRHLAQHTLISGRPSDCRSASRHAVTFPHLAPEGEDRGRYI
jgi:hypothetical protein